MKHSSFFTLLLALFVVFPFSLKAQKPTAVDLGLSVKWASFNLGATSPEGSGDFFAWGETKTKNGYYWDNLKYGGIKNDEIYITKYNDKDKKTRLEMSDDAARVKLGGKWRMPTDTEWLELRDRCTWRWTSINSVNGYKVTGPNGNSIFLPAAGFFNGEESPVLGMRGWYWSSSLIKNDITCAWCISMEKYGVLTGGNHYRYQLSRSLGYSIRPVTD